MKLTEAVVVGLVALLAPLFACSGAQLKTRTAYSVEVTRCIANEREIVDRSGTTEAQDRADLAAERARCDDALARIVGTP